MKKYLLLFFLGFITMASYAQGSSTKPNILFIAVDDLKPVLGCYGDTYAQTPNFDRVAQNGTTFLNTQCQWPVCGPSRSSLLTGKRPDYTKVWDLQTLIRDMNPSIVTLPQYFKNNGYTVVGAGKIFDTRSVDNNHDTASWSTTFPFMSPQELTFNASYGAPLWNYYQTKAVRDTAAVKIAQLGSDAAAEAVFKPAYEIGVAEDGVTDIPDDAYNDGAATEWALGMINTLKANANPNNPFFLALGLKNPHLPFSCPKKYYDLYVEADAPLASYTGRGTNIPSLALRGSTELFTYPTPDISMTQSFTAGYTISEANQKKLIRAYYANVSYADAMIGKMLDKLQAEGLANNTIVIVWGDHGWHLGDHKLWGKHTIMDHSANVPLIIYDPRNPSANSSNSPSEFIDIYPTLCDLAGLTIPSDMDGKSLKPIMVNPSATVKDYAVSQFSSSARYGYSFKTDRYRYTVWLNTGLKATDKPTSTDYFTTELYDYVTDPNETTNYINDANYATVKTDLAAKAAAYFAGGGGIVTGTPAAPTNVIPVVLNGDFENATYNTSWTYTGTGGTMANTTATDAAAGNGGAKINVTTAGALNSVRISNQLYTATDLSGKTIRVSFKAKCSGVAEQLKVRLYHKVSGNTTALFLTSSYIKPTTTYATYTADFVIPSSTTEVRVDFLMGDKTGTTYIDDVVVTDETTLKDKKETIINVGVYPIPANTVVTIDTPELIKKVTLYDFEGKEIKNIVLKNKTIDVTNYLSGTYHLVIETSKGTVTRKLIIAH